jgi:hypothetical protein
MHGYQINFLGLQSYGPPAASWLERIWSRFSKLECGVVSADVCMGYGYRESALEGITWGAYGCKEMIGV